MRRLHGRHVPVPGWWVVVAVAVGVLVNAAPVLPSPGQWQPDIHRAVADDTVWVDDYLAPGPQAGARIPNRLWVAWAEGETIWARAYLARQSATLEDLSARATSPPDRAVVSAALDAVRAALRQVASWPTGGPAPRGTGGGAERVQPLEWRK